MSKIGRRPIELGGVRIEIKGQEILFTGKQVSNGQYVLPKELKAEQRDNVLFITPTHDGADVNMAWGLHRALLANKIKGADVGFEKKVIIVGLGFKAIKAKDGLEFSLGFSHKIPFPLPEGVTVDLDKTGQQLTVKSVDKELLGLVCSRMCELRPVEPYKGTGVHREGDRIRRKAGKSNA